MVNRTSQIWNISKWKIKYFELLNTCMEISVSLSCLLVHELPYQTAVVCCNSVFCSGSLHMDHCTISYSRVGLAQAHPNYEHMHLTNSTKTRQYITYAYVLNEVYVLNNHVRLITRFYSISNYHAQGKIKLFSLILSMLGSMSLEDDRG